MDATKQTSRKNFKYRIQHMVECLRNDILNGTYPSGQFLPAEKELVKQFSLSNKSVRLALDMLVQEGLITKIDRVGSRVTDLVPSVTTLTLAHSFSIERDIALSSLLHDFHQLYPSIRVKLLPGKPTVDYMDMVKEQLGDGTPDLFTLNNLHFQHIVESGYLRNLDSLSASPQFYRFTEEAFSVDGKLYSKPLVYSPTVLAYNRSHFEEAQIPEPDGGWTWKDAIVYAARLTEPDKRHGLYFYLLSDYCWPALLLLSGERFELSEKGELKLKNTPLLESVRLSKQLIDNRKFFPGYFIENISDVTELFKKGKVSMIIANYMTINDLRETSIDFDLSPLPYLYEPRSMLHVIGLAVNKHSKQKEAAQLFADYLGSPRAQQLIRNLTLSIPAHKKTAESQAERPTNLNRPSRYYLFREIVSSYRLPTELNLSSASFNSVRTLLKKYCANMITEEEFCSIAEQILKMNGFANGSAGSSHSLFATGRP